MPRRFARPSIRGPPAAASSADPIPVTARRRGASARGPPPPASSRPEQCRGRPDSAQGGALSGIGATPIRRPSVARSSSRGIGPSRARS